ncbi:protein MpCYP822-like4 [Marchantia polymorpha subsp. ruderalis]|uniref:Cytochrome P450 n=2 Tax=Marchantia polymorpha TaxID=3197 RepID=A0A176WAA4_MARPO|nr:hypothetical protein AXG93_1474s1240 [Marchantia polymorpha subsp. ruderalis]PTQ30140.1 hypothetical protein MARPO_0129s0029 [Marchantia polymorpha]PTQ30141.1 hypothetical protein MARPO_0129s0029 [Marchantia polymorpha]PTQ30142.1 hypothetical protein MARPO_0129s0029 [Marchantia polymorpha]BBN01757.1 hypothetical protein Mp_2g10040 [Marchantia polymorpha subsp. ruderalis]|eukprot:PTQ30140.1 hypothetical protein MARPO_0129s0029 [Marchantia polymorpha]
MEAMVNWESSWLSYLVAAITTVVAILLYFRLSHWQESRADRERNLPPAPYYYPLVGNLPSLVGDFPFKSLAKLSWNNRWPIFRLKLSGHAGPSTYVISSLELAHEVLKSSGLEFACRNVGVNFAFRMLSQDARGAPRGVSGNTLRGTWRNARRVMVNGLVQTRKVFGDALLVRDLEQSFRALEADGHADGHYVHVLLPHIAQYLVNHTLHFVYGYQGENSMGQQINAHNETVVMCLTKAQQCLFFPILQPFLQPQYTKVMEQTLQRKYQLHETLLSQREIIRAKQGNSSWYFCDTCLEAEKTGEITHDDALHIIDEIFLAGVMTTAATIEWGLGELVNQQGIIKKLQQEMDAMIGVGVPLRANDIDRLPYLKATIKEIFRMHPAVPLLVPHMNPEDAKLGSYDIPKESLAMVNVWKLQRDPELWHEPNVFNPDRFLEHPEIDVCGMDNRLLPFGAGRRMCPGLSVGLLNTQMWIGRLVQRYHITLPQGVQNLDLTPKFGASVVIKNGLRVCLKRRQ